MDDRDWHPFLSGDRMWEKYRSSSPYVYAQDNPMRIIDLTGLGPEDVERIVSAIDGMLNRAWDESTPAGGAQLEHGGTIVEECTNLYGDQLIYAKNFMVGTSTGIGFSYPISPDESILGTYHTHVFVQPDGLREGAAPSDYDIGNLGGGVLKGKYEIIEAGSKRFAIEVVDEGKARAFVHMRPLTDLIYGKIERTSGTSIERIFTAAKYAIVDFDSGMKLYQSVDKDKLKFEEVK
jgi:hypothetical protein